jgi:hypothetical protein
MKAFDIKRTLLAALAASLPIACGTGAPTGPSAADATVSALRLAPPLPPIAPHQTDPQQTDAPQVDPHQTGPGAGHSNLCMATQAEVYIHRGSLPAPILRDQVLLELLMLGPDGAPVDAQTCRGIVWSFGGKGAGVQYAEGGIITPNADTRFATVEGTPGDYMVVARAPNGLAALVMITLR